MSQLPDSVKQRIARDDAEVKELCERLGYGFVMDSAARQWKQKDPIGAFTIGPCVAIAEAEAELASKVVTAAKDVLDNYYCDTFSSEAMTKLNEAISAYVKSEG